MRRSQATARVSRVALLGATVLAVVGCAFVSGLQKTRQALKDEGIDASLSVNETNGFTTATIDVRSSTNTDEQETVTDAACTVWRTFPFRVDEVVVQGSASGQLDRTELFRDCGLRPAGYDGKTIGKTLIRGGIAVLIVGGIFCLAVVVGVIVLIVTLVKRSNRKRADAQAAYPYGVPAPGYGYPPPPGYGGYPPPPGWGPPPPGGPAGPPPAGPPPPPAPGAPTQAVSPWAAAPAQPPGGPGTWGPPPPGAPSSPPPPAEPGDTRPNPPA